MYFIRAMLATCACVGVSASPHLADPAPVPDCRIYARSRFQTHRSNPFISFPPGESYLVFCSLTDIGFINLVPF